MEKKILIIAYYFYPESGVGAKRYNLFTEYFSKKLKTLNILTIDERYVSGKDESIVHGGFVFRTRMFPRLGFEGNKVTKFLNKILLRIIPIDYYSALIIPLILKGRRIIKKNNINTIIVTGPPFSLFVAAYLLSIVFKIDLIVDYQDPWFFDNDNGGKKLNFFLEKLILKKAQKIILNTPEAKDEYLKLDDKINLIEKTYVIPNPFLNGEEINPRYLEKEKKVIVYAGNFYGMRRLNYIFEPLIRLFPNQELMNKVSIHVFGRIHPEDSEIIKKLKLSDLIVEHGRIEFCELRRYLMGADILYLSQGKDHCYSVPYKLIDYLTIKKPILVVTSLNSSTYNFMRDLDCGLVADIDNPNSIFEALREILINERKFSYMGMGKYSLENIAEDYFNIIKN
jgi:glycosyltransferase involved in cell wall biosynthesis